MRTILIDPFTKMVSETDCAEGLEPIHQLIKADCFTCVYLQDKNNNAIFLDDEGLFVPWDKQEYFILRGYPNPLAGRAIILGADSEGESIGCDLDVAVFNNRIAFIDKERFPDLKAYVEQFQ